MTRPPYPCAECWRDVPWFERLYRVGTRTWLCSACYGVRQGTYQLPLLVTGLDVITDEDEGESEVVTRMDVLQSEG